MKRIAAITMLRHDMFFLRRWVEYYSRELGMENLYIFFDGTDHEIPPFCDGANCSLEEHTDMDVRKGDAARAAFISEKASELFRKGYDMVIGTDVDEILAPDPACDSGLAGFLSGVGAKGKSISALGIDVGHDLRKEGPIAEDRPLLEQRHSALLSTRYSKASVLLSPASWGSGFHRVKGENFHITAGLFLFHFGSCDRGRIEERFSDGERIGNGWKHHLHKRERTIRLVSRLPHREWERWTRAARAVQNIIRPPYAWNKPAMFGLRIAVAIPERFRSLI